MDTYQYETRLNIAFQPLELIDERALADACPYQSYNQTLCQVNGSVVRLGVVQGEYHWHKHDHDDKFFYVIEGALLIDLNERTVEVGPVAASLSPKELSVPEISANTGRSCRIRCEREQRYSRMVHPCMRFDESVWNG